MKKIFKACLIAICFSTLTFGQDKSPPPTEEQKTEEDIIRISSRLVLVDTLVLDNKGRQITDLSADDFEIYQDGKLQEITNFAYVNSSKNTVSESPQLKSKTDKKAVSLPPVSVRSNQEGRIVTFVITDGSGMSAVGVGNAREEMKKFINEQMLPNDKVAIYRTRARSSLLQYYTSNKEVLRRIVDKVWWTPLGLIEFESSKGAETITGRSADGSAVSSRNSDRNQERIGNDDGSEEYNRLRQTAFRLNFVIDRLKNLPGRKLIFLISDGIPGGFGGELKQIADKAARSSVVIYTLSSRGLTVPGMIEAADDVRSEAQRVGLTENRINDELQSRVGLAYLAETTGGKFIYNKNFLNTEIKKILEAETGYYLLGYQPDDETFKGKGFHNIEIKLKRPDLEIASRQGFFGREETKPQIKPKSSESPLYKAIVSPFQEKDVNIRLTTITGNDTKQGDYIRALFHIKGEDLTFTDEADGTKKVILDVVAVTLDENGKVIEEFNRTYPIRIPKQGFQIVQQNGLDYSTDMPVKKTGFYNFRLAVRDNNSKRLGSAGEFVEIPDTKKGKFFMSGLYTTAVTAENKPLLPKNRSVDTAFAPVFLTSIPSIRQYNSGSVLSYVYNVYNAKLDKATKQPKLTKQIILYKDGKLLVEAAEKILELQPQSDISHLQDYGFLRLNENMEKGEYILQVIIRDKSANKTTSQWIDFEIVK